jgi:hypothetical protein
MLQQKFSRINGVPSCDCLIERKVWRKDSPLCVGITESSEENRGILVQINVVVDPENSRGGFIHPDNFAETICDDDAFAYPIEKPQQIFRNSRNTILGVHSHRAE